MVKTASHRYNEVVGSIVVIEVAANGLSIEGTDLLLLSHDWVPQGMPPPKNLVKQVMDMVIGRVLHHFNLLEDYIPFPFDLIGIKDRVQKDIREELDGKGTMLIQHLCVKTGILLFRKPIEDAPHRVDLLGYIMGAPALRSLEDQVLDKMGNPLFLGTLLARSRSDPNPDGNRPDMGDILRDDADSIFQDGLLIHLLS